MPRLLHTADWQIGRQFGRFESDDGAELASARLGAVQRIADLANTLCVDAVLVAGDIFDIQTVSDKLLRRTFQSMSAFNGHWVLLPGNHDAALADSVWSRAQLFGLIQSNIHLLDVARPCEFAELGFVVLPAPLTQRQAAEDLTAWFDAVPNPNNLIRIGLAHGSIAGRLPDAAGIGNPIAPERARTAQLDYLALGDWHGCLQIDKHTWYSGTPEADRFRSNNPGQVLEVYLDQHGAPPVVQTHRVGRYEWHRHLVTLSPNGGLGSLTDLLSELTDRDVLRLKVSGRLGVHAMQELRGLLAQTEARLAASDIDTSRLNLMPDDDEITGLQADGYLGEVLTGLRAEIAQASGASDGSGDQQKQAESTLSDALGLLTDALLAHRKSVSAQ